MKERVQKIISNTGFCSRRKAEILIQQNRVYVNNKIIYLGEKADANIDRIRVDNYIIPNKTKTKVLLLNKPPGIISSCNDEQRRKTVLHLIPVNLRKGMHPIGRLDMYSRGALILTNNGYLTFHLTHPKYEHSKTYQVLLSGNMTQGSIEEWRKGIILENKKTKQAMVTILKRFERKLLLEIVITEGRNRQIRKIAEKFNCRVLDLKRVKIANINIGDLKEGDWRELDKKEWEPFLN